jgi:hypothetical protein
MLILARNTDYDFIKDKEKSFNNLLNGILDYFKIE